MTAKRVSLCGRSIWNRGADAQQAASDMQRPEGQNSNDLEFYLAGNVELRQQTLQTRQGAPQQRTIRAEEIYYDVNRNVAVAYNARLEMKQAKLLEPLIVTARELLQINVNTFEVTEAVAYGSKLPSDPDLTASLSQATIDHQPVGLQVNQANVGHIADGDDDAAGDDDGPTKETVARRRFPMRSSARR